MNAQALAIDHAVKSDQRPIANKLFTIAFIDLGLTPAVLNDCEWKVAHARAGDALCKLRIGPVRVVIAYTVPAVGYNQGQILLAADINIDRPIPICSGHHTAGVKHLTISPDLEDDRPKP